MTLYFEPLTDAEEFQLFRSGVPDYQEKLVLHAMKAALDLVRRCCRNHFPMDEQISIAGNSLVRALRDFHPQQEGQRFIIYARPFIRGAVAQAWRDRDPVDYGDTIPEKPEIQIAMEDCRPGCTVIEHCSHTSEKNEGRPFLSQLAVEPDFRKMEFTERWDQVAPLLKRLTESERRVLTLTYASGFSFVDIGEMVGSSRAAVQQTHALALRKLRNWLMDLGIYRELAHG